MEQDSQTSKGWVVLARKLHRYFFKQRQWSHLGSLLKVKFGGLKARGRRLPDSGQDGEERGSARFVNDGVELVASPSVAGQTTR